MSYGGGLATLLRVSRSLGPVPEDRRATPRWGFARVSNRSMLPTLRPGDRLLLDYRRGPRPGDLVVARLPGGVVAVKRAAERRTTGLGEPGWWLLSDNAAEGSDSRQYGAVADPEILAVVVRRIWPLRWRRAVPDSNGA
jgi:signal peptidase I